MSVIDLPTSEEKQRSVLMALQNGQHLTTQQCYRYFGTTELRKHVCRLRDKGYNIISRKVVGENFNEYYLATN